MRLTRLFAGGHVALFALIMLFTAAAGAKDGRDFAGYYSLTNVAEKGGAVELTLALQLFNYSGADLKQAVVTVRSSPGPGSTEQLRAHQGMAQRQRRGNPPTNHCAARCVRALVASQSACRVRRLQRRKRARIRADGAVEPPAHDPGGPPGRRVAEANRFTHGTQDKNHAPYNKDSHPSDDRPLLAFTALAQQNIITTAIGGGPNDMPAIDADIYQPVAVAVDSAGNYYFADSSQNRVFKVNTSGILTVVAGSGIPGFAGDGVHGGAPNALLNNPSGVAVDAPATSIFRTPITAWCARWIHATPSPPSPGSRASAATRGTAALPPTTRCATRLGLAVDGSGNLYIADQYNSIVRKLVVSTSTISNYAGTGTSGYSGDGAAATGAELYYPSVVAVDSAGNVYIADSYNYRVREVTISNGHIRTIAGNGTAGYSGDAGAATSATFNQVTGDRSEQPGTKVTIADTYNVVIRQFTVGGTINTIAGGAGAGWCGDGGSPQFLLLLSARCCGYKCRQRLCRGHIQQPDPGIHGRRETSTR